MRVWRFLVWFVVVSALITIFGVMTAPLLLVLIADMIVGTLIIRDLRASLSSSVVHDRNSGWPRDVLVETNPALQGVSK